MTALASAGTTDRPLAVTRGPGRWLRQTEVVVLGCVVAYLPFVFLGYGTDIDVANVLRTDRHAHRTGVRELKFLFSAGEERVSYQGGLVGPPAVYRRFADIRVGGDRFYGEIGKT